MLPVLKNGGSSKRPLEAISLVLQSGLIEFRDTLNNSRSSKH
jgi:hypothetical protein